MEEYKLEQLREVFELYKKATLISYGSPDQYQYRQNELLKKIAEVILFPFFEREREYYELGKAKGNNL